MIKRTLTAAAITSLSLAFAIPSANAAECVDVVSQTGEIPAAKLVYIDENATVSATFCDGEAGDTSEAFLVSPGYQYLGTGHVTAAGTTVDLGFFLAGTELVFSIYNHSSGYTYFTGPGERNPDGVIHGAVTDLGDGSYHVGFEDVFGGGDQDFNDVNLIVSSTALVVVAPTVLDTDVDGSPDYEDNCPFVFNPDQANADGDSGGDACDACALDPDDDIDGDGICGDVDNCAATVNSNQSDYDGDGDGDECDADDDADGIADAGDNCPLTHNADQADWDQDGAGNACDTDDDGDSVIDNIDQCPMTESGELVLSSGCSIADLAPCEPSGSPWKNHGGYVKAVVQATKLFIAEGLLTQEQAELIISAAASSSCGH